MGENKEFLKKRAKEFWDRAKEDFECARFNLVALDVEQAVQLWFKYLIFLRTGDFPKTHYFDILINALSEVYGSPDIVKFYNDNVLQFKALEDGYICSRYLPREFNFEEANKIIDFAEKVFTFTGEKLNVKFL